MRVLRTMSILALGAALAIAGPAPAAAATPSLAQLVGQKLVVAMSGTTASSDLLARIGRGEVGGVILFGANVTTASALRSLSAQLEHAAAAGGQLPLLIATDQEGGSVKRVPWAPPTRSAPQLGTLGSTSAARSEGTSSAYVLRCAGVNTNLAPVADVPSSTASFMYQQGRTWSFDATVTATLSSAFAAGVGSGGGVPAMKHFPGLGLATANTDSHAVTITASAAALSPGLDPYRTAIANGIPLVMLSNATYTAWDSANAAGWSHAIGTGLLRTTLGFTGVTMTDSLTGIAAARGVSATSLALKAAQAGTDMILLTGTEASTSATYASLLAAATQGTIPLATLQGSYQRIAALKARLGAPVADTTPPSVAAPVSRLYAASTLGTASVPVRTSWSATDPCAVSASTVERRVAAGSWTVQSLPSPGVTSVTQSLAVGATARYVTKAADGAGNVSGWAYGATFEPFVRESSSSLVTVTGRWSTAASTAYSGGSTRYATSGGASASYTFTGTGVGWVAALGPTRGSAQVYLDGVRVATVSLYSATTALKRIVYAANWATQATHTIRIVVVGTAGHPRVDVDAFARIYRP